MSRTIVTNAAAVVAVVVLLYGLYRRLQLSMAKHPSVRGHARLGRMLASLVPYYEYEDAEVFRCDGAGDDVVARREAGFGELRARLAGRAPRTRALTDELQCVVSDMRFTNAYRVPFQFRRFARRHLGLGTFAAETSEVRIRDLDGNWSWDVSGSYGVNLLGHEFYKRSIERGVERVRDLGPVLGPYHPLVAENVALLRRVSGLEEISFHMSGTEAVMQAVRLARYHTRRPRIALFCGAYHGWWDGVQPGVGNPRPTRDVFTLKDVSDASLRVLGTRRDIACVLVNPLQALHPNAGAGSDATLIDSGRGAGFDRAAYAEWLRELRRVCMERDIVLIFDEVFVGFRLAVGGAQEYFGVSADLVTYGKTLGGGLPVGVLCGKKRLMKRYRSSRPLDICFARGTFNSHPYVMATMNEFLRHVCTDEFANRAREADALWNARARSVNDALEARGLPVRIRNLSSIWIVIYTAPGRFNWLLQYYLRAEGLALGWVGTGRLIFSHDYSDADFDEVRERFLRAVESMRSHGWWDAPEGLTNRAIRSQVLCEMLARRLSREPRRLNPRRRSRHPASRPSPAPPR